MYSSVDYSIKELKIDRLIIRENAFRLAFFELSERSFDCPICLRNTEITIVLSTHALELGVGGCYSL